VICAKRYFGGNEIRGVFFKKVNVCLTEYYIIKTGNVVTKSKLERAIKKMNRKFISGVESEDDLEIRIEEIFYVFAYEDYPHEDFKKASWEELKLEEPEFLGTCESYDDYNKDFDTITKKADININNQDLKKIILSEDFYYNYIASQSSWEYILEIISKIKPSMDIEKLMGLKWRKVLDYFYTKNNNSYYNIYNSYPRLLKLGDEKLKFFKNLIEQKNDYSYLEKNETELNDIYDVELTKPEKFKIFENLMRNQTDNTNLQKHEVEQELEQFEDISMFREFFPDIHDVICSISIVSYIDFKGINRNSRIGEPSKFVFRGILKSGEFIDDFTVNLNGTPITNYWYEFIGNIIGIEKKYKSFLIVPMQEENIITVVYKNKKYIKKFNAKKIEYNIFINKNIDYGFSELFKKIFPNINFKFANELIYDTTNPVIKETDINIAKNYDIILTIDLEGEKNLWMNVANQIAALSDKLRENKIILNIIIFQENLFHTKTQRDFNSSHRRRLLWEHMESKYVCLLNEIYEKINEKMLIGNVEDIYKKCATVGIRNDLPIKKTKLNDNVFWFFVDNNNSIKLRSQFGENEFDDSKNFNKTTLENYKGDINLIRLFDAIRIKSILMQ